MKILIADDQVSIHTFIEKSLESQDIGITAMEHAYDGEETVRKIKEFKPEVLILDIEMPYLAGIEVLQMKLETPFFPYTVILSAYDKFQYAREAMKYGAKQYLLKPIDPETLVETIQDIVNTVRTEARKNLMDKIPALFSENSLNEKTKEEIKKSLHILKFQYYATCMISVENGMIDELYNTEAFKTNQDKLLVYPVNHSTCYMVIRLTKKATKTLHEFGQGVIDELEKCFGSKCVTLGWSELNTDNIEEMLRQSRITMLRKFYEGHGLYHYEKSYFDENMDTAFVQQTKQLLLNTLKQGYSEYAVRDVMEEIFTCISNRRFNPRLVTAYCEEWLYYLYHSLPARGNSKERLQFEKTQLCHSNFHEVKRLFMEDVFALLPSETPRTTEIIMRIKHYIDHSPGEAISLETVSEKFYMNKSQISRLFKAEVGVNFWSYITSVRLERARSLLEKSDLKIYQIARNLGFQEESHFSQVFKKYIGCSPSNYRLSYKNKKVHL